MRKAILLQSDVGKTKGEIRGNLNSYSVMIEDLTTGPAQDALKALRYKVNRTCT